MEDAPGLRELKVFAQGHTASPEYDSSPAWEPYLRLLWRTQ
jgi:hypothetical protein